jgi:hypothetical protein
MATIVKFNDKEVQADIRVSEKLYDVWTQVYVATIDSADWVVVPHAYKEGQWVQHQPLEREER